MNGPILALNPNIPERKTAVVAEWCNEHEYNHYKLLYSATVLALEGLPHILKDDAVEAMGAAIYQVAPTDKHRFLSVTMSLKSLISTYRFPILWLSDYTIANPAVPAEEIVNLALTCRRNGLSPADLLDVALCRASVEELIADESEDGETAGINCELLTQSADVGKIVGQKFRDQPIEDRVGMLFRIARAMCGNILGSCGRLH